MRIFVGNLSREISDAELQEAFQPFGTIESVAIIKDKFNGQSKGFAFVEMPNQAEAEAAITGLHKKELKGRPVDVNEARPRTERKPQRSGGGHGRWGGNRGPRRNGGGGGNSNSAPRQS
jgi:RNA recognition motif-containing protein